MATPIQEIESLERKISEQITRTNKNKSVTLAFGLALAIFISGYFYWLHAMVQEMLRPADVVGLVAQAITDQVPIVRSQVERTAEEELPKAIDGIVNGLVNERIPQSRKDIERMITSEAEAQLNKSTVQIMALFEDALANHGDEVREMAKDLKSEEGRANAEERLYKILNEAISDPSIQIELMSYELALEQVTGMLKYLSDPTSPLSDDEKLVAEIVATLREVANRSDLTTGPSLFK